MLTPEAIQKIVELGQITTIEIEGRTYATGAVRPLEKPTVKDPLAFTSLSGLAEYVNGNPDRIPEDIGLIVHLMDHNLVRVVGNLLEPWCARSYYAQAAAPDPTFRFGNWYPQEEFVIALQVGFVPTDEHRALLGIVSNLTAEEVRVSADNGVSQEVTRRAGVHLSQRTVLPNPVTLTPWRTFREVEQPESAFILRVRKAGDAIALALFEADGGKWKDAARKNVLEYLSGSVSRATAVLG